MIEPNKYTDETIHVANWLLLSGEVDLAELAGEAVRESLKTPQEDVDDCFIYELQRALETAVEDAMSNEDARHLFDECNRPGYWTMPYNAEEYEGTGCGTLIRWFIAAAVERVNLYQVASLICEHRPAVRQALEHVPAAV
jgi:hypothetical protein